MARKIGSATFDLEHERSLLSEFQVHCQSKRIAVIYGPKSREDSYYMQRVPWNQLGIAALMESLAQLGIPAKHVNPTEPGFLQALAGADYCFLNMHGEYGEDGRLQGLLDYLGKGYTGSGVQASAIGVNKVLFKLCLLGAGLNTPRFVDLSQGEFEELVRRVPHELAFPMIAKPVCGGSSIGSCVLPDMHEATLFFQSGTYHEHRPYFVEEFIKGRSLTVGVL